MKAKEKNLAKGRLVTKREGMFGVQDFQNLTQLVGAKILAVGFHGGCKEGGFAVDFQHDDKPVQRLVLGYTELGEWVEFLGDKDKK